MSSAAATLQSTSDGLRLDKWLWAARFYKTRSLAADDIDKGRIAVNGQAAKPSRNLRPGDVLEIRQGPVRRTVVVRALSAVRGPAPVAQALYEETADSLAARQQAAEARRLAAEPALAIAASRQGRPTKRNRRDLERVQDGLQAGDAPPLPGWQRWRAELDDA
ncbi:RNA-binding S4 domain-containing protein [Aquabacterium sp. OR-4]|uniref:RNA-binding S4 domain-containing protein n=1 Tax=Aquabacterium sp. OR-4 TaxID=2978127 RepID=UPI0021B43BAD|nr:RNA-binding S4 domain-containing protein [Aquabacterium sp. OR-4]MDT7835424.1 RNA-binding S4 domain-containing protein [Aquabacterium sp. OR-4]